MSFYSTNGQLGEKKAENHRNRKKKHPFSPKNFLRFSGQKFPTDTLKRVKEEIGDKIESPSVREYVMMELEMTAKRYDDMAAVQRKKKPKTQK